MAGIYIHIPFCKTRCIYCDFYSTTLVNGWKERFVNALCKEIEMRKKYLDGRCIDTVYFGGGTPSLLSAEDFAVIFDCLSKCFDLSQCTEITLEANPDDLTLSYLKELSALPFNRISMGVQTFDNRSLSLLNRRHTAEQAIEAVRASREVGFRNLSIDLIYGLPGESENQWQTDLEQAIALHPEHISAYHLTYENGTPLERMLRKKQVSEVSEETSLHFFTSLVETLTKAGYEQYEISNFCRTGLQSRHNSSYWQGVHYLGLGPSAHSFNGTSRSWNVAAIKEYVVAIERCLLPLETEELSLTTRYNERIITALRTSVGLSISELKEDFGDEWKSYCLAVADPHLRAGRLKLERDRLRLTQSGLFLSDGIMSDLLYVDD